MLIIREKCLLCTREHVLIEVENSDQGSAVITQNGVCDWCMDAAFKRRRGLKLVNRSMFAAAKTGRRGVRRRCLVA